MKVAIIRYNAGNTRSVLNSLSRLGVEASVTDDADAIARADRVIFPGVGEASSAMAYLRERSLDSVILSLRQPVLGVCLGMQLLCRSSEENDAVCLDILPGRARRFPDGGVKVPHVGWNAVQKLNSPLFAGVPDGSYVYFVHSYYVEPGAHSVAEADHGVRFSAAAHCGNFYAVQFHPERSGAVGERILKNFLEI